MGEARQTVAGAYDKIAAHERECGLRYDALNLAISGVRGEAEAIKRGIRQGLMLLATLAISLIAWLAVQVYGYVQRDIERMHKQEVIEASLQPPDSASRL
ncbi:MAG: hypothetical protein IOB84_13600 [Brevundimonas sp.]|nr:hypothetical protein [Brevundimonas sp.]